jgi:oligopeptidase B
MSLQLIFSPVCIQANATQDASIVVLKCKEVPGVDLSAYATARLYACTEDGRSVPISVLYRPSAHELKPKPPVREAASNAGSGAPFVSPAPLLLYGYGAYGISWDPGLYIYIYIYI